MTWFDNEYPRYVAGIGSSSYYQEQLAQDWAILQQMDAEVGITMTPQKDHPLQSIGYPSPLEEPKPPEIITPPSAWRGNLALGYEAGRHFFSPIKSRPLEFELYSNHKFHRLLDKFQALVA